MNEIYVGSEDPQLRLESYLDYFRKRAMGTLDPPAPQNPDQLTFDFGDDNG